MNNISHNIPESPAYGIFLFHSWYGVNEFVRNMKIFVQRIKVTEYSSHKLQTTLRKLYGRYTDLVHTFYIPVTHMLEGSVH